MCYKCDEDRARFKAAEVEELPEPVFGTGMQYRVGGWLGEWKDVEEGQTSFDVVDARRLEFRRKPSVTGTFDNLDGTTAEFFDEEWLMNAIRKRIERGENDFDLKVRFK